MEHQNLFEFAYNLYEEAVEIYSFYWSGTQMELTLRIMDTCTAVKFSN